VSKYSVKVNDPALPDGHEVEVPGLGVFKNGSTRQISEEQAEYFRDVNARLVDVETDDRPAFTGAAATELQRGPTVLQAFKDHPVVSVEAADQPVEKRQARAQKSEDSSQQEDKKES
jgi:hypothetical protein